MEQMILEFERALAEYKDSIGKTDRLVAFGEMIAKEFRKNRDAVVVLGQCLSDFYATAKKDGHQAVIVSRDERAEIASMRLFQRQPGPHQQ
jgi:hypothetical protein